MVHYEFDQIDFGAVLAANNIRIGGICHVGAHEGQEVAQYKAIGFDPIVLVEADPLLADKLIESFEDVLVWGVAAGAEWDTVRLHTVDDDKQLSSLLRPINKGKLARFHEIQVQMLPLSAILDERVNVLVVDVQGTELDVIDGAPIEQLDMIVLEVGTRAWYNEQVMRPTVEQYMEDEGWKPVFEFPHGPKAVWFDVAYVRS